MNEEEDDNDRGKGRRKQRKSVFIDDVAEEDEDEEDDKEEDGGCRGCFRPRRRWGSEIFELRRSSTAMTKKRRRRGRQKTLAFNEKTLAFNEKILAFNEKELCKYFKPGDHVKVVSGVQKGATGIVVKVEGHVFVSCIKH